MSVSAEAVISILESRYDHQSARVVYKQLTEKAGVDSRGPFDGAALDKLSSALLEVGTRVDAAAARLRVAAGAPAPAKAAPPAKAPEPPAAEAPPAQPAAPEAEAAPESEAAAAAEDDAGEEGDDKGAGKRGRKQQKKN